MSATQNEPMETTPCLSAFEYLEKNEVEPVSECLPQGSAQWYIPMRRMKALFEDEPDGLKLESIFLCPCNRCERDGGLVEDRSTNFNSLREGELRNDYAAMYALLIYIRRPGLIRIFQKYELKLHGTSYLQEDDFLVLRKENLFDFDVIKKKVLRLQYSFLVRILRPYSDITAIPLKELLPIKEDPEPKGVGSFAEVRCFEFQDEEYRSHDFGPITRFARKIFKQALAKSAVKEWNNLQSLSKATNHLHLMPALGAYWHGSIFFILQEEADMSLHDYLKGQGVEYDSNKLWNQMRGLADGLNKLHQLYRGTKIAYHQDLKPANILIVRGTLKIADFGLLEFKPVPLGDTGTTGVISAHNTGYYAAPRQGRYTREDDIWSLACIFSELATSDVQGRDEIAKYREARIADGPSSNDSPKFFLEQKVKSQVLDRHRQLQHIVHPWTSTDQADETRKFQGKFYSAAFFTLLNSMFRHGQTPSTISEASDQFTIPDAGQVAETIEVLRKEAMPVPSLSAGTEDPGSSPHRTFRVSEDLVSSLDDILEEFRKSLSREIERKFRVTTLADFKQFLVDLQTRQYAERCQQGLKRLVPLIEALEQFGQLLGEFCNYTVFMAFIWGPINFILETASTHTDAFNEVLSMYRQIGLNQPLRSQYEKLLCDQPEMEVVLSAVYYDIIRVHTLTLTFFQQRRWKDLFAITWTKHKSRLFKRITNMATRLDLVMYRGTILEFRAFQNSCAMEDEQARIEMNSEDLKRRQAVYTWLKSIDMENEQYNFAKIQAQYPRTGRWLLDHTTFKEWFDPQFTTLPTLLWLHGNPGAGKTILASMVVEEARNLLPTPTILFFYFKQGEGDHENFVSMARSLLGQLLKQEAGILDYVYNRCCCSGEAFLTSRVLIEELLLFALGNCNSAYIVLDGLDKCSSSDERSTIVEFFRNLIENLDSDPGRLRCLFVSRKDSARKDFNGLANIAVGLENNEDDIDVFSHVQSQKLGARLGVSEQRLQEMDPPPAESFTIGLIYVKPLEVLALTPMLDERFAPVPITHGDQNDYTLGRIGSHNVVIVGPARGDQGTVATAQFVTTIRLTFPNISVGLLVGIGGGIPHPASHDVRLGDVVVGAPETGPALVQYDLGKRTAEGFKATRTLAKPPAVLRKAVNKVEDKFRCLHEGEDDILAPHLERFSKYPRLRKEYQRPSAPDRLFKPTYIHEPGTDCLDHDAQFEEPRELRESDHVVIHYGTILSGSTLMKSSQDLDELSKKYNAALCFETEAAGLMDVFPCLVIRGICDYSDSHKSDRWQGFAARAAAAYAREVLLNMSRQTPRMPEVKAAEDDPGMGLYRAVFSGTGNKGVQVGYNMGSITNTFGRE